MTFLCLAITTQADPYLKVVEGLVYSIDGETATVCAGTSGELVYQADIVIPATIEIDNPDDTGQKLNINVTAINGDAFKGTAITSITINAKIKEIPDNCFQECTELKSISFGEGVTTIGSNAFNGCTQLGSITIPLSVTTIGSNAFDGCANITTLIISGSGEMNNYDDLSSRPWHSFIGQLTSVVIESGVTKIGNNAFSGSTKLESINIPATITTINSNDFSGYSSLIKVIFANINHLCSFKFNNKSDNPLSIAHHLYFSDNPDVEVTAIDLSETGITEIKQYAFSECWGLERIHIPATVTTIGKNAFDFEDGKKANKPFPKTSFASIESLCKTDFETKESNPIYYQNDVYIGTGATAMTTIDIPFASLNDGHLGANILANASKIVTVSIPEGTDSIAPDAFYYCENLQVANYPSLDAVTTMKYGNEYSNPLRYAQILKVDNKDQSELELNNDVQPNAFIGAKWLKKVTFNSGVKNIGKNAFKNCTNLTTVTFNTTTLSIEEEAFSTCMNLTSMNLPDGLKKLGKWAFRDCRKLPTVTIPASCTIIEIGVFLYCWELIKAEIKSKLETIPQSFFYECKKLNTVILPEKVTTIGPSAFGKCKALTAFPTLKNLTTIQSKAFNGCSGLTNLVLPNSVVFVDESAFAGCSGITSLTIPESTTDILSKAFDGCTNLKDVYSYNPNGVDAKEDSFGDRVSSITLYVPSEDAKANYSEVPWINFKQPIQVMNENKIKLSFYVNDNEEPLGIIEKNVGSAISDEMEAINNKVAALLSEVNGEFSGWNEDIDETIPNEDKNYYGYISYLKEDNGFKWHLYPAEKQTQKKARAILISLTDTKAEETDIDVPPSVSDTEKVNLKVGNVVYPVEVIASNAFEVCNKITKVTLPDVDNLEIESAAFKGRSSLQQVKNFPNNMKVISDNLFSGCSSLARIHVRGTADDNNSLPTTITEIGREAFRGCIRFMLKAFPDALTTIGYQAFFRSGIKSISFPAALKTIGYQAFYDSKLDRISFPNTLRLDNEVFKECKELKTVVFENSFNMAVPDYAFMGCTQLDSVILSKAIPNINQGAFKGCSSLTNITIPASVEFIGNEAFAGCNKLLQITEEREIPPFAAEDAFDESTYANAFLYVPEDSYNAYHDADTWKNFTKLTKGAESNLIYLLDGVKSYKEVDGVQKRTRKVKAGATIKIDDENDALDEKEKKGREFSGWEFSDCQGKTMVMPDHDVTVKGGLQYFVTYYDLENNEKANGAFFYDEKIVIPVDVLNVSESKFTITFKEIKKKDNAENEYEDLTVTQDDVATTEIKIKMPAKDITATVTYAQSEAVTPFINGMKYRIVNMNTETPHAELIDGSQATDFVTIPPTINYEGVNNPIPVTVIGNKVFKGNRKLTQITIPVSIVEMGTENFANCNKLASVDINANISTLPNLTFKGCGELQSVDLPESITTIGDQAFFDCKKLKNVTLPPKLKDIDEPKSIGELAFFHALGENATLTIHKDATELPSAYENTFDDDTYESTTLKIMNNNLDVYKAPWTEFTLDYSGEGGSGLEKCKDPSISYENKKLVFKCEEQGATIVYKIVVDDQKKGEVTSEGETSLFRKYIVTAYAKKAGMRPSASVSLELPWYSKGDVNDDGFVTVADAVEVIKICTGDTGEITPVPTPSESTPSE